MTDIIATGTEALKPWEILVLVTLSATIGLRQCPFYRCFCKATKLLNYSLPSSLNFEARSWKKRCQQTGDLLDLPPTLPSAFPPCCTLKHGSCAEPLYLDRPPIEHPPLLVSAQMTATGRRRHPTQVFSPVAVYTVMFLPYSKECLDFRNVKCFTSGQDQNVEIKQHPVDVSKHFTDPVGMSWNPVSWSFSPSSTVSYFLPSTQTAKNSGISRRQEPWLAERGTINQQSWWKSWRNGWQKGEWDQGMQDWKKLAGGKLGGDIRWRTLLAEIQGWERNWD